MTDPERPEEAGSKPADPLEPAAAPGDQRRDAEGLPLDREPTLDDVRGSVGSGRNMAVGCTILVALVVFAFWVVRSTMAR